MGDIRLGIRLATIPKERVRWWSRGRLAFGKLHIVEGNPGVGKSTLLTQWTADATVGSALPDGEGVDPMGVIWITVEDAANDTIRPRLEAAGGDANRVWLMDEIPIPTEEQPDATMQFELPTHCPLLEEAIQINNVGLVIIDPFADFLADDLSENSNKDTRKALGPLSKVAERTGAIIVVVRHLNKSSSTSALFRGGGSMGILGKARIGLLVEEDPRDPEVKCVARGKGNLGKRPQTLQFRLVDAEADEVAKLEWLGVSDLTADDLLAGKVIGMDKLSEWDDATEWLKDYLWKGPREVQDIYRDMAIVKISKESVMKANQRLRVKQRKMGFGGKWHWELPYVPGAPVTLNGKTLNDDDFPED